MLPRHLLPQIPEKEMGNFKKYCEDKDVSCKIVRVPAKKIRPIQKHLRKEKIKDIQTNGHDGPPLVISSDYKLMDGHHRWAADLLEDGERKITCFKFSCPIERLLSLGHTFDGSEIRSIKESLLI